MNRHITQPPPSMPIDQALSAELRRAGLTLEAADSSEGVSALIAQLHQLRDGRSGDGALLLLLLKVLCLSARREHLEEVTQLAHAALSAEQDKNTASQVHFYKAFALEQLGLFERAIKHYEACLFLDPSHLDAPFNLGNVLFEIGEYARAIASYELCEQRGSLNPQMYNNFALCLARVGQTQQAMGKFDQAIELDPAYSVAISNKAWFMLEQAQEPQVQQAKILFLRLLEQQETAEGFKGLGLAELALSQLQKALQSFTRAIELSSGQSEHFTHRGVVYRRLGLYKEAIADFQRAITRQADSALAYVNLSHVYLDVGDTEQAMVCVDQALELDPNLAQAHLNKALLWLANAQFVKGFEEYQWRWQTQEHAPHALRFGKPWWGSELVPYLRHQGGNKALSARARVLIWNEQGLGDDLYFLRFLSLLDTERLTLTLRVDSRLTELCKASWPGIEFVSESETLDESQFDAHLPLGDLAVFASGEHGLVTDLAGPYLNVQPSSHLMSVKTKHSHFETHTRTHTHNKPFRVGLSWRSFHPVSGARRSIPLAQLMSVLAQANAGTVTPTDHASRIEWVSLQHADVREELEAFHAQSSDRLVVAEGLDLQGDVTGVARLIKSCDLVISIDNTTAHLSCALGVPTWVLLNLAHDWRWHVVQDRVYGYATGVAYRRALSTHATGADPARAIDSAFEDAQSHWQELLRQVAKDLQRVLAS